MASRLQSRLIIGAMSGTSADGVDVAIVAIRGRGLGMKAKLVLHHARPYDPSLRQRIFALRADSPVGFAVRTIRGAPSAPYTSASPLRELADVGRLVSLTYAAAINEALNAAALKPKQIAAIAAHGQTLFHDPPLTIQWLDPALLAWETSCPVISDFRRADCAAGGQGAPLVPFADYILFRHGPRGRGRVLLNIGGVANLTWLPPRVKFDQVIAFDTGPGNCVSDWLMREHQPSGRGYDAGGQLALGGKVDRKLLKRLMSHEYCSRQFPKSTDGPAMIAIWQSVSPSPGTPGEGRGEGSVRMADLLATACAWTAESVAAAIRPLGGNKIILSGGGAENAAILRELRQRLPDIPLLRIDDLGIPSAAKEALAFALLGAATLDNLPANVPQVTGAARGVVLGSITPRP